MSGMNTHEVREKYLQFFEQRGHKIVPSAPLVPENDPTTLFTGSGMQPMVSYLLGQRHPLGTRIVDSQKCFRLVDIDEVGDNRHTTFFEMLGNWSLGDYFKQEQIPWMFAFLTQELGLDPKRLYVTCFRGNPEMGIPKDEESAGLWQELFSKVGVDAQIVDFLERDGIQAGRIFYYGEKKNWWSRAGVPGNMPVGEPGGPDTEMFWDFGADLQLHEQSVWKNDPCHVNCDCGRFLEIGNNVFMEYVKTEKGFEKLSQQNVDFGGGLERMAAALNDNPDVFLIDLFSPAKMQLETLAGVAYDSAAPTARAFRVILDHLRAIAFLLADGVVPSHKDQGYFARRLIRRAVRFGSDLGIKDNFCADITQMFIDTYAQSYPALKKHAKTILQEVTGEENKFRQTLVNGLKVLSQAIAAEKDSGQLSAREAFDLYQSYGFPIEMTVEIAQERGLKVDEEGFAALFQQHQSQSRAGAEQKFKGGLVDHSEMSVKYHTATHLLHQALRTVLGSHVFQKGSNITLDRLRFDYSHPAKLSAEEIKKVEDVVNEQIGRDLPVRREEMTIAEAKEKGALGLFEHKYAEKVTVYAVGDFSREICGGPHVEHTGGLGTFKIIKEESAGAGLRRIKAILQ